MFATSIDTISLNHLNLHVLALICRYMCMHLYGTNSSFQ